MNFIDKEREVQRNQTTEK